VPTTDRQVFYLALAELIRRQSEPPISKPEDLTAFELGVYSQNGEDGVLAEIFRRLGPGRREFVEFGVGRGVEGNCVALADVLGWSGLFMEGDETASRSLVWKYRDNPRVRTAQARVTAENVEELLAANGVSDEPDVISIDVDGNDLWIWKAMTRTRPRVVVIEYNAHLDHTRPLVIPTTRTGFGKGPTGSGRRWRRSRAWAASAATGSCTPTSPASTPSSSATTAPAVSTTSAPYRGARRTTTVTGTEIRSTQAAGVMSS
jgi:hypothetical protein